MSKMKTIERPTQEQLAAEVKRLRYRSRYHSVLRSTIYTLIVVAAVAVLVATIWMPVLQIYGSSMTPTLNEGDIVVSLKGSQFRQGELAAFYIGNKILVKRCIALPGQVVDMDAEGNIYVDGKLLDEPYLTEISFGDANINFPYASRGSVLAAVSQYQRLLELLPFQPGDQRVCRERGGDGYRAI